MHNVITTVVLTIMITIFNIFCKLLHVVCQVHTCTFTLVLKFNLKLETCFVDGNK